MSPTHGRFVCAGKVSQSNLTVFGSLMVEKNSLFSILKELNYILGFYTFHILTKCKPWPGLLCIVVLFLFCSKGVCPRSKCKLTTCWCSVRQAMDPGVELHLLRGKVPFSSHKKSHPGLVLMLHSICTVFSQLFEGGNLSNFAFGGSQHCAWTKSWKERRENW